ncbi:hypothetical protein ILYODFUR_026668 [Ilyodon furcidens]|uniref:Uncharacterized protein n=1 Tax=Ilyodon furcidens TaxID=33524 RepID=A0ABV0V899_9TELE
MQGAPTKYWLLETSITTFVKNELKNIQTFLSSGYSECSKGHREDHNMLSHDDEEQRKSRGALFTISLHFMRNMKQWELADNLQRSERDSLTLYYNKRNSIVCV